MWHLYHHLKPSRDSICIYLSLYRHSQWMVSPPYYEETNRSRTFRPFQRNVHMLPLVITKHNSSVTMVSVESTLWFLMTWCLFVARTSATRHCHDIANWRSVLVKSWMSQHNDLHELTSKLTRRKLSRLARIQIMQTQWNTQWIR